MGDTLEALQERRQRQADKLKETDRKIRAIQRAEQRKILDGYAKALLAMQKAGESVPERVAEWLKAGGKPPAKRTRKGAA